jgi:hypothetical protein
LKLWTVLPSGMDVCPAGSVEYLLLRGALLFSQQIGQRMCA